LPETQPQAGGENAAPTPAEDANRPAAPKRPRVKVYIEGRYRKLVRDLPQTIFYCPDCKGRGCERCEGFGKLTRDSVQELIARVAMPRFKARTNKFHGAGREDLDVRMLGEGRPFVLELVKAARPEADVAELEAEINRRWEGRIEVRGLRLCGRKRIPEIKESRCAKEYRVRVRFDGEGLAADEMERRLAALQERGRVEVVQTTPARVQHRRAMMERKRWVQLLDWEQDGEEWLLLLRTAHGTYVKEAISGEEGRTRPSLSELLGVACHCRELDVMAILPPDGGE